MDVEIERPHVHHHRRGIPWYDLALPIAALFVSLISIYIAWHHGKVMQELVHQNEKLVEANSLPYLQISGSNGNGAVSFDATNEGVGPAKIFTAEIFVDGRPVKRLAAMAIIPAWAPRRSRDEWSVRATRFPSFPSRWGRKHANRQPRSIRRDSLIGLSPASAIVRCSTIAGYPTAAIRRPTQSTNARR